MSGSGGLTYDRYQHRGKAEWLMRIGPPDGRAILIVPPLFEELNRTRALLAGVMRRLASNGFACMLPDLPGTGESERALGECGWQDWISSVRVVAERLGADLVTAAIRGGALLDDVPARAHWRFSPAEGASLARDLARSGLTGGDPGAGYEPQPGLLAALGGATPVALAPLRTVRLASDLRPADARLDGPALWRRSEPAAAPALADAIAADIADWVHACAGC